MKINFSHVGLADLCGWFGITRQAYYQNSWKAFDIGIKEDLILIEVRKIRTSHRRMGTRKLYEKLKPIMLERTKTLIKRKKFICFFTCEFLYFIVVLQLRNFRW